MGLGASGSGRVEPVQADTVKLNTVGLGVDSEEKKDDIYSAYQQQLQSRYKQRQTR